MAWFVRTVGVALGILVLAAGARAQAPLFKTTTTGAPNLKSIEAISFGPKGMLLIGDGRGSQVVAIDTGDTTRQAWSKTELKNIKAELAGRIGTTAKGIEIVKMAVNPVSHTAYFAVRNLDAKKDLILTLDGTGKIGELMLDNVKYVRVALPGDTKVIKITDITWAGDRVLVAAQASETFASKVFSITAPQDGELRCACYSTETYHVAHNQWETRAPIRTVLPYEEKGKKYVVGAFTCTPVVKYSLDDIQPGAKVKGQSVIEVGSGNTPLDMFIYEKGGKKHILMNTFRFHHKQRPVGPSPYWTVRIDYDLLAESANINKKALWRVDAKYQPITERAQVVPAYHGVVHMDQLDRERAVVVRTGDKGGLDLAVLALP
jgi:hypothetical protein